MRLLGLLILFSTLGFAGTWSGYLVDSRCYAAQESNVSPDTPTVTRDMTFVLRECGATPKTKKFSILLSDWSALKLDPSGNQKAAAVVHRHAQRSALYCVKVSGTRVKKHRIATGPMVLASIQKQR